MSDKKEIRSIDLRASADEGSRVIEGYALVFNRNSELIYGEFIERISSEALNGVLEKSDVFALLDHNKARGVLARSKKMEQGASLTLTVDKTGLNYRFEAPRTALGDEALESIRRSDITGSSFAFSVKNDNWEKQADGTYIRTILEFDEIYDVSPVYSPAYADTNVALRKLGEIGEEEKRALQQAKEEEERKEGEAKKAKDKEELNQYFKNLKNRY